MKMPIRAKFFLTVKDRDAVYKCLEKDINFREYQLDSREQEDFKLVKRMGMKETGILVSCSDYHIFVKLKMTRKSGNGALPEASSRSAWKESAPDAIWRISRGPILRICCSVCLELMKLMKEYRRFRSKSAPAIR